MINPQETLRPCGGKQNTETVYYVELEGRSGETEGEGEREREERKCLSQIYPKNPVEKNNV